MAKTKTREVSIRQSGGTFNILPTAKGTKKEEYDFDGLDSLRKLLSKEKARLIDVVKYQKPTSIYSLAKILKRPFKAVSDDIKLLIRFGIVEITSEKVNNRTRHRPIISVDHLTIHLKI